MPVISGISLFEIPERHILSQRIIINFGDFPDSAGKIYAEIMKFAGENGLLFSGPPFVCYHNEDLENLDVELGFPTAKLVDTGHDRICGRTLPAGKVVSGIYLGPYEETDPLMMSIFEWISKNGYEQQGRIYNYYLNESDRPENELLTQIIVPVE